MITILILSVVLLAVVSGIVTLLLLLAQQARPCPRRPEGTTTTDFKEQG